MSRRARRYMRKRPREKAECLKVVRPALSGGVEISATRTETGADTRPAAKPVRSRPPTTQPPPPSTPQPAGNHTSYYLNTCQPI